MITSVDEEARHRDLANLQAEYDQETRVLADQRDSDIAAVAADLEKDLAKLESEGAKAAEKKKARDAADKTMAQIRKRADAELDRKEQVWDRFKNLKVADLEGDEGLYRAMRTSTASTSRARWARRRSSVACRPSTSRPSPMLRETIKTGKGQRKTRALKRLKVVNAFLTTDNSPRAWSWTPSR